jgi:hypothetical protein
VYERDLSQQIETFEKFKNSIFVRDANRDLELLDLEYWAGCRTRSWRRSIAPGSSSNTRTSASRWRRRSIR